jgi:hypothetical protein
MSRFPGKPGARPYNGFTPAERQQKMQSVKAAIALGEIVPTRTCSVCARTFPYAVGFHSEDYADPFAVYPVCRSCHYMIHIRFWRPGQWVAYIARLAADGWFQCLSLDPLTLSRPFRETYPHGLSR